MDTGACKITLHMVMSLDGLIAKKDDSVDWFETTDSYEKGTEQESTEDFLSTVDCFVMGARTYEHAVALSKEYGWAYGNVPILVMTHQKLPDHGRSIECCSGNLSEVAAQKLRKRYRNVWVVGGASLIRDFIHLRLADEIRLSILPLMLGEGIPLFDGSGDEQAMHLMAVTANRQGMVELHYQIRK